MTIIRTQIVDPLDIATRGILRADPLTLATRGYIVILEEEIIPPSPDIPYISGGGPPPDETQYPKKRKRITAKVIIDGKEYKDSVIVNDLSIKLKDVSVEIDESAETPKIRIILPENGEK